MTRTLIATADPGEPFERCAGCGHPLPERSPRSRAERRCQDCWWAEETRRYHGGQPVHPLAQTVLSRRHGDPAAGE
jgi:hypothetical protein